MYKLIQEQLKTAHFTAACCTLQSYSNPVAVDRSADAYPAATY